MGVYRLQVLSRNEVALHWQIQKGGGFHYAEAESMNEPLEVTVAIGCVPSLWLAGVMPLPEGMDEMAFAGLLSGAPTEIVPCESVKLDVPASAEIVLEGIARPGRRAMEGPFGDHFGHYSHASEFPVLEVQCITRRKNAVYHSAVVGKPPQEDKAMGESITKIFAPLIKIMKLELADLWAFYGQGFTICLLRECVSVTQKSGKDRAGTVGRRTTFAVKCVMWWTLT